MIKCPKISYPVWFIEFLNAAYATNGFTIPFFISRTFFEFKTTDTLVDVASLSPLFLKLAASNEQNEIIPI